MHCSTVRRLRHELSAETCDRRGRLSNKIRYASLWVAASYGSLEVQKSKVKVDMRLER